MITFMACNLRKHEMKAHKVELNIKQKQQPSGVAESTAV